MTTTTLTVADLRDDVLLAERDRLIARSRFTRVNPTWTDHGADVFTEAEKRGFILPASVWARWD